jgi:hypothetical protein
LSRYATVDEADVTKLLPLIDASTLKFVAAVLDLEPINIHPVLPAVVLQVSIFEVVVI